MHKLLIVLAILAAGILGLAAWSHQDVKSRGNAVG